jgi:ABC-type glycerol-3-phosphate transport system substrate-binding protein
MKHRSQRGERRAAAILALFLAVLLLAGCGPQTPQPTATQPPASPPSATPAPTAPPAPEPTPEPEGEKLVYVPSYEPLPAAIDGIATRFPRETEDGLWFLRVTASAEGSCYCLMRGGRDASDPVTVASFPPDIYAGHLLPTPEGTVWVDTQDFTNGEISLLEIDGHSGETLREVPFPAENGSIARLFDLPDGRLGISTMLPNMAQAAYAMAADGTIDLLEAPVNESMNYMLNVTFVGTRGSGLGEGECLAYDKDTLFAFTPGSRDKRELLRWADWGVSSFNTMPLSMEDGVLRLMDMRYKEYVTLTPTPESAVKPRQEVTMACLYVESAVDEAVRNFNRRSTEYYITIRDYSGGRLFSLDVRDQAITAMNLDIASGKMPDLLAVQDGVPFKSYAKKGLLRDLGPWLALEGIQLLPQLQQAGTVDGKTCMVCGSFALITATGSRDFLGDLTGWTPAEARALAASLPDCKGVFTSMMTRDLFLRYLSSYLEGYLDWDAGTASFDSPEFREVLEFAAALPTQPPKESTKGDGEVMSGTALAAADTIASVNNWQVRDMVYMGKLVCPGFPAPDRAGTLIYMTAPMALSAAVANPEGACAFLRSMLDAEAQTAYTDLFPSTAAAFVSQLAEAMREPTPEEGYKKIYVFSNGGQFLDPTVYPWEGGEGEKQPRTVFCWMDDKGSVYREEKMYAMSQTQRDSLLALLDGAVRSSSYDQVIASIVQEETGALFAGQRTSSETAARIRERVALYMAEQGG